MSGPDGHLLPHPSSTAYIFSFDTKKQSATQLSGNCTSLLNSMLCYYTCNSAPPSWYKISEYVNYMGEENSEENFGPMEENNGDSGPTVRLEITQRIGPCLGN